MNKIIDDIGIYTNIYESGNKTKDGHKLYFATCKVCNKTIEKPLADLKRNNTLCYHNKQLIEKINDMPAGWTNQSELNLRIYYLWKAMIMRTTQKFWDKYPTYEGTTVDDSWRKLSQFVNDIKDIPGYEEWVTASGKRMMLDKDTLVEGNKHYSKETCCFISHADSNRDVHKRYPENLEKARITFIEHASKPVKIINKITNEEKIFPSLK